MITAKKNNNITHVLLLFIGLTTGILNGMCNLTKGMSDHDGSDNPTPRSGTPPRPATPFQPTPGVSPATSTQSTPKRPTQSEGHTQSARSTSPSPENEDDEDNLCLVCQSPINSEHITTKERFACGETHGNLMHFNCASNLRNCPSCRAPSQEYATDELRDAIAENSLGRIQACIDAHPELLSNDIRYAFGWNVLHQIALAQPRNNQTLNDFFRLQAEIINYFIETFGTEIVNHIDEWGKNPAHLALERGNTPMALLLINKHNASVNAVENQHGATLLHLTAACGYPEALNTSIQETWQPILWSLKAAGYDAVLLYYNVAQALIEKGAKKDVLTLNKKIPYELAMGFLPDSQYRQAFLDLIE